MLSQLGGGEKNKMKTILAISIMAVLATGVIAPSLQEAYALKADTFNKMGPKAFGEKTKNKTFSSELEKTHKSGFESIKKEQIKTFKKIAADYKAKQLFKSIYRLG